MTAGMAPAFSRLLGRLPWRLQSRNNLMVSTANLFFEGVRKTPPMPVARQGTVGVHALVCHRDVNMMLTSAKSFLRHLPQAALVLHDDGSITKEDRVVFEAHLPGMQFISRAQADDAMRQLLPPDAMAARQRNFFLLKLFDFNHFHRADKTLLLDSDIVFLNPPTEIVHWAATPGHAPFYNADFRPTYRAAHVPAGAPIPTLLNAGFMGFDGAFTLEQIWQCCREIDYWLEDQTIYALLLRGRAHALDAARYRVFTGGPVDAMTTAMVHFIGPHRFETLLYPRLARRIYRSLRQSHSVDTF